MALRIRPAIVLFGDSITQQGFGMDGNIGWASLLSSDYSRRADVLNRGFSGYNTRMGLDLLPSILSPAIATTTKNNNGGGSGILFATVFFGANDASLPGERQHVPVEEYGRNLEKIISHIRYVSMSLFFARDDQQSKIQCLILLAVNLSVATKRETASSSGDKDELPIILITPPPFNAAAWREFRKLTVDGRANEVAKSYGDKVKEVGSTNNCKVLDSWDALEGGTSPEVYGKYLSDGLHLNAKGNEKLYNALLELIKRELPDLAPMEEGATTGVPLEGKLWEELC